MTRVWIQNRLRASPTVSGIISWPFPPVMTGGGLYVLDGLNVCPQLRDPFTFNEARRRRSRWREEVPATAVRLP